MVLIYPIGIGTVTVFDTRSIKSVKQTGVTGFPDFSADSVLEKFRLPSGVLKIDVSTGIATAPSVNGGFKGLKVNDIIEYFNPQYSEEVFNRVSKISDTWKRNYFSSDKCWCYYRKYIWIIAYS